MLPMEMEATNLEAAKKERRDLSIRLAVQHRALVKKKAKENLGERKQLKRSR